MKLGLLTDIHEHVDHLQAALAHFRNEHVDQIVVIGDLFLQGNRLDETCRLLAEAGAVGVWGNHDFGLCICPTAESRRRYSPDVIRFMTSLQPRLSRWECYFSHVEPWLNPEKLDDLWYFEGPPDESQKLDRIFNSVPDRIMFSGHYHQWLLTRPQSVEDWHGECPISLSDGRFFVVVGALCEGHYAIFDTGTCELIPYRLPGGGCIPR